MTRIPVVVGFGGINAAGRSSGDHGYRRLVMEALDPSVAQETWRSLAALMNLEGAVTAERRQYLAAHTLVRKLEPQYFDPDCVAWNRKLALQPANGAVCFDIDRRNLPEQLPPGWHVEFLNDRLARITMRAACEVYVNDHRALPVHAAGQLPSGFMPEKLYANRSHPRGLQLTIFAASDALGNLGLDWQVIADRLPADAVSVYAGSAMSQLDAYGNGGLLASRYQGKRVTSKHIAMGLAEMPADFVNAYVLGSLGATGLNMGACATFLYNLRQGILDIREGRARVALVGSAEAPLLPEVMEGFITMGALATDPALLALDPHKGLSEPDYRRACRPFGENCGFVLGEGAQFVVLMDDELALELGADIQTVIAEVYVNADGYKKSISSPGVGNYLTFAKAVGLACRILGDDSVRHRSFVHAHGTGTPQNRVTESQILNRTAEAFGIRGWPVAAIKCYLGHTMAAASGDQLINTLGVWRYGIIPGIATLDGIAADVHATHLALSPDHVVREPGYLDVAFLNAKGFGGNNATAVALAPHVAERLLEQKHGSRRMQAWREQVQATREQANAYDRATTAGKTMPLYRYDHDVREDQHIDLSRNEIHVKGYRQPIRLDIADPLGLT